MTLTLTLNLSQLRTIDLFIYSLISNMRDVHKISLKKAI